MSRYFQYLWNTHISSFSTFMWLQELKQIYNFNKIDNRSWIELWFNSFCNFKSLHDQHHFWDWHFLVGLLQTLSFILRPKIDTLWDQAMSLMRLIWNSEWDIWKKLYKSKYGICVRPEFKSWLEYSLVVKHFFLVLIFKMLIEHHFMSKILGIQHWMIVWVIFGQGNGNDDRCIKQDKFNMKRYLADLLEGLEDFFF